jgi:predicted nucleic acid-binding protein
VANAIITYSRRRLLPAEKCLEGIQYLKELPIKYIQEDWALIETATALSVKLDVAVYDAVYIAVASSSGATIITADYKLFKKIRNKAAVELLEEE